VSHLWRCKSLTLVDEVSMCHTSEGVNLLHLWIRCQCITLMYCQHLQAEKLGIFDMSELLNIDRSMNCCKFTPTMCWVTCWLCSIATKIYWKFSRNLPCCIHFNTTSTSKILFVNQLYVLSYVLYCISHVRWWRWCIIFPSHEHCYSFRHCPYCLSMPFHLSGATLWHPPTYLQ
jgi:hypothetical protein